MTTDDELEQRLRAPIPYTAPPGMRVVNPVLRNPDGPAAADRISLLREELEELQAERNELRMLLVRYGDRVRMANASAWQQTIDAAFEARCLKCGGTHLGSASDCLGRPLPGQALASSGGGG